MLTTSSLEYQRAWHPFARLVTLQPGGLHLAMVPLQHRGDLVRNDRVAQLLAEGQGRPAADGAGVEVFRLEHAVKRGARGGHRSAARLVVVVGNEQQAVDGAGVVEVLAHAGAGEDVDGGLEGVRGGVNALILQLVLEQLLELFLGEALEGDEMLLETGRLFDGVRQRGDGGRVTEQDDTAILVAGGHLGGEHVDDGTVWSAVSGDIEDERLSFGGKPGVWCGSRER